MAMIFQNHNDYALNYDWTRKAFDQSETLMDFLENYLGSKQMGYGTDDNGKLIEDLTCTEVQALTNVWKINRKVDLNKLERTFHHHGYDSDLSNGSLLICDTQNEIQVSIDEYGSLALYNERTGKQTIPQESIPFLISILKILNTHMYYVKEK